MLHHLQAVHDRLLELAAVAGAGGEALAQGVPAEAPLVVAQHEEGAGRQSGAELPPGDVGNGVEVGWQLPRLDQILQQAGGLALQLNGRRFQLHPVVHDQQALWWKVVEEGRRLGVEVGQVELNAAEGLSLGQGFELALDLPLGQGVKGREVKLAQG